MLATSSINGIEAADLSTIGVQRPRGRGGSRLSKQFGQRIREQSLGRGRDSRPREEAQRRKMNNRKGWVVILNQFIDALKCFCRSFLYSCQSIACLEGSVVHSPCKRRPRLLMASEAICSEAKEIASELDGERSKILYSSFTFWPHLFSRVRMKSRAIVSGRPQRQATSPAQVHVEDGERREPNRQ